MGLSSTCTILLLFSMVSLYHASHICEDDYYCPVYANCSGNNTNCEKAVPCNTTMSIANLTAVRCDEDLIVLNFTKSSFSISEGNGPSSPVLELSRPLECCTISVRVLVQNNSAHGGEDFERLPGDFAEVIFPAGKTRASFQVTINDDDMHERSETFRVTINSISVPHGVVLGSPRSSVVTIIDNDAPRVRFQSGRFSVGEGDGAVFVNLVLSNPSYRELVIQVYSIHDTATECDYGNGTYSVSFPERTTVTGFRVNMTDDNVFEEDETFKLAIDTRTLPSQVTVNGDRTTVVTIEDNEEVTRVGFDRRIYRVHEDEEFIAPVLTLDKPADCCVIVRAMLRGMTAERGDDYGYTPSKIYNYTFYAGDFEALPDANISIIDDDKFEEKENFYISIIDVSLPYGYEINENGTAEICIMDNDNGIEFEITNHTVNEDTADGHISLTLKLFRPALMNITVQLITVSTTATEHADYVGGPFRVLIPEGEQEAIVTVGITNDDEEEPDEKFNVIITPVGLPSGISAKEGGDLAEITILNDDYDCNFDEATYTINEGDAVSLQLTLTTAIYKNVEVNMLYINRGTTNDTDYSALTREAVFPAKIQGTIVPLNISTTVDSILESNETIEVVAILPEDRGTCSARVIIVDDNTCEFSSETYEVDEGGEVELSLTLTKKLSDDVNIDLEYYNINNLRNDVMDPPKTVTLVAGDASVGIGIRALLDTVLENNESLIVSAHPPSDDGRHCNTTLTIVDDNKLRVSPSDQEIREGTTTVEVKFTLDKPLLTQTDMLVPWSYRYDVYSNEDESLFIDRYLRFSGNRQEVSVDIEVKNDNVLEHNETFVVTARPPAEPKRSRDAVAIITIIDDEALTVGFTQAVYTLRKDGIQLKEPELRLLGGTAAFDIDFLLREIPGDAIGAEHNPTATVKDYEEFDKNITIARGGTNYKLLIDTIDNDIVEPPVKYFEIEIDENSLPDRVSVGEYGTTRINIMDDDVSTITLKYEELKLTKGLFADIRVMFTLTSRQEFEREIEVGETILKYPEGNKFPAIKEVHLYVPDSIQDRVIIRQEDKDYVVITWVS